MAFSEIEMSILAQLAYKDVDYKAAAEESLYNHLKNNKAFLEKSLGEQYKPYINALLDKVKDKNYIIVDSQKDTFSGFSAFAISTPENEVVVASRGTQELNDWITDAGLGLSVETGQHKEMEAFVNRLEARGYDGYYFTGHSLGGNLATHGAITVDDLSKVKGVYTYNAPGFNEAYWALHGKKLMEISFCITNFQNEYDYVSSILRVPGKKVVIASSFKSGHAFFKDHSIKGFKIKDGKFVPNDTGEKHPQTYAGTILGEGGQIVGFGWLVSVFQIYNVFNSANNREICRDFSADAQEMLVKAAKETEEEKWWQVTRWDCWYKVDKFFGGFAAEWDRYSGNVDAYYRKLIDMNDSSVKEIKAIFEKVYKIDNNYAKSIREQTDNLQVNVRNKLQEIRDSICPTYTHNGRKYSTSVPGVQDYAQKQQLAGNCTSTAWCMGLSIITGESYDPTSWPYWGEGGARYVGYEEAFITHNVFGRAYDELQEGKPTMYYGHNGNNISGLHAVVIVGVADGADRANLQPSDFLVIDPGDGKVKNLTEVGYSNYNGQLFTYKDNP